MPYSADVTLKKKIHEVVQRDHGGSILTQDLNSKVYALVTGADQLIRKKGGVEKFAKGSAFFTYRRDADGCRLYAHEKNDPPPLPAQTPEPRPRQASARALAPAAARVAAREPPGLVLAMYKFVLGRGGYLFTNNMNEIYNAEAPSLEDAKDYVRQVGGLEKFADKHSIYFAHFKKPGEEHPRLCTHDPRRVRSHHRDERFFFISHFDTRDVSEFRNQNYEAFLLNCLVRGARALGPLAEPSAFSRANDYLDHLDALLIAEACAAYESSAKEVPTQEQIYHCSNGLPIDLDERNGTLVKLYDRRCDMDWGPTAIFFPSENVPFEQRSTSSTQTDDEDALEDEEEVKDPRVGRNLCIWNSKLYLTSVRGELCADEGVEVKIPEDLRPPPGALRRLMYMGDTLNTLDAVQKLRRHLSAPAGEIDALLAAIRDPVLRKKDPKCAALAEDSRNLFGLNPFQIQALEARTTNLHLIQGPPGTGKSRTLYFDCVRFAPLAREEGGRTLLCCPTNKALDADALRFEEQGGLSFCTLGAEESMGEAAKRWTPLAQALRSSELQPLVEDVKLQDAHFEEVDAEWKAAMAALERMLAACGRRGCAQGNPLGLASAMKARDATASGENVLAARVSDLAHQRARAKQDRLVARKRLREEAGLVAEVICADACVVLCTMSQVYSLERFPGATHVPIVNVVVDEAGTVSEPAMALLLAHLPRLKRLVLVGDQAQLPPFSAVTNGGPPPPGFFARAVGCFAEASVPMLREQHRMHPQIAETVSMTFYQSKLITNEIIARARQDDPRNGLYWIDHQREEAIPATLRNLGYEAELRGVPNTGYVNEGEVEIIEKALARLASVKLSRGKSVLVIAFYKAQAIWLRRRLRAYENVIVATVDSAQGSEADIVILSCVRSNQRGSLGFIGHPCRVNVAASRAKDMLVIVGNAEMLGKGCRTSLWGRFCYAPTTAEGSALFAQLGA